MTALQAFLCRHGWHGWARGRCEREHWAETGDERTCTRCGKREVFCFVSFRLPGWWSERPKEIAVEPSEALDRMRAFLRSLGLSDEDVSDFEASLGDVDSPGKDPEAPK